MNLLKKTIGFMAAVGVVPAAFALTARPSVVGNASARMPTMSVNISGSVSGSTSSSTLLENSECIDAYTSCLKGSDVCGPNFEECTNNTLFFAKRPLCASTLMQCSNSGVNSLFGTSNQTSFSNKNSDGEYTYPTAGSVLGQLIEAAAISNRYDTSDCVKRYTNCLKKDDVCGSDFELCTSNTEFKKQKLFCESTLARCQSDGIKELFGTTNTTSNPTSDSRLGIMISEGAALAAVNAVSTCYKVVDQCFLNACAENPYKCKEGSSQDLIKYVENVNKADGTVLSVSTDNYAQSTLSRNEVSGYIKNSCLETIGGNKYCYATFIGNGVMPTNSQLMDEDNRDEIYSSAYSSRMNDSMRAKIDDLITQFDKKVKERCSETIVSCAMRTCGEGSGAACYASAFNSANTVKGVTNPATMEGIKTGCEAVVNNDTACQYAAATFDTTTGALIFEENSIFDKLFTAPDDTDAKNPDPVGAVATLNAKLSTSYNQTALDSMKKQCQAIATSCVKSMCGTDYQNCYRNRTDIYSTLTNTGNDSFDKSMNKVGGVLDHTIVLGLCLNTVKSNSVCEEHIKAEMARSSANDSYNVNSWGAGITNVRDGWLDAGNYGITAEVQDVDADGNLLCTSAADGAGTTGRCDDASGMYMYPKMVSKTTYAQNLAERQVFRDLIADLEMEAQAKYNAKLTKQQNMCMSGNAGGIIGNKDMGSTYLWVKLKNNKVPSDYSVSGLQTNDFVASNDLYGSFCRIRVTIQSDDKYIQDAIRNGADWTTAYFAAGDAFTCGSWIPSDVLEELSQNVGDAARADAKDAQARELQWIMPLLGTIGGAVGGAYLGTGISDGKILSGLTGKSSSSSMSTVNKETAYNNCKSSVDSAKANIASNVNSAKNEIQLAVAYARTLGVAESYTSAATNAAAALKEKYQKTENGKTVEDADAKDNAENAAKNALDDLKAQCEVAYINSGEANTEGNDKSRRNAAIAGSVITGVAGGVLSWGVTNTIQNAKLDSAERAAMDEWMNNVGKHIRCFIGSDEVGIYGDMISTSME